MAMRLFAIATLCAALAAPAAAQDARKVWRVGFISPYSAEYDNAWRAGFRDGMRGLGYVEGRNLVIEMRHAAGSMDRFPQFVRELVGRKVDLLLVHGSAGAQAAKAVQSVPVVFVAHPDPVGMGVIASLARPGGNITGVSDLHTALGPKRIELLKQVAPATSRVAILLDPTNATYRSQLKELQEAAPSLQVNLLPVSMRGASDIAAAFETMQRERVDGMHILGGSAGVHLDRVVDLSLKHRLPVVATTRKAAEDGTLMSYGANFQELYRRAATQVDKIFRGAKPGDLPVEQAASFELVVNMKTAAAIGVTVPTSLLQRADLVIR
jgi:putative ABC transport system substrate-binding protein